MEPVVLVLVLGVLGGIALALLVFRLHAGATGRRLDPPSAGAINIARVPVDGIGGLGLVAMALTVAIFVPSIRFAMATALISGAALGAILIARRRGRGPLPSGSDRPGAHTIFIEEPSDRRPPGTGEPDKNGRRRGHMRSPIPAAPSVR